jgi:hypothetical protein
MMVDNMIVDMDKAVFDNMDTGMVGIDNMDNDKEGIDMDAVVLMLRGIQFFLSCRSGLTVVY